jgi:hypothetical protein
MTRATIATDLGEIEVDLFTQALRRSRVVWRIGIEGNRCHLA